MSDDALDTLSALPEDVLAEVVREGELKLQAQLQASLAADSRALALASFTLTASTALLGAAAALSRESAPDYPVIYVVSGFGLALLVSGGMAVVSARPVKFAFPGNEPRNWVPADWDLLAHQKRTLKRARVEQAKVLQSLIARNRKACEKNATLTRAALALIFVAAFVSGVLFVVVMAARGALG